MEQSIAQVQKKLKQLRISRRPRRHRRAPPRRLRRRSSSPRPGRRRLRGPRLPHQGVRRGPAHGARAEDRRLVPRRLPHPGTAGGLRGGRDVDRAPEDAPPAAQRRRADRGLPGPPRLRVAGLQAPAAPPRPGHRRRRGVPRRPRRAAPPPRHRRRAHHRGHRRPVPVRRRHHHDPHPPRRGDCRLDATTRRRRRTHWLHDAAREVLYVGRTRRTAPPRLRKALAIRDRPLRLPRLPRRPDPLRRPPRHRMVRRRTDRPVEHAADLHRPTTPSCTSSAGPSPASQA